MKYLILAAAIGLAGCDAKPSPDDIVTDQCLRIKLAQQCVKELPKGPTHIHNSNDWDEVVKQCDDNSYWQSKRKRKFVAEGCAV